MTIRPVDFGGLIQRTDDVGALKHQQDAKPMMDQQNIQTRVDEREDKFAHEIIESNESEATNNKMDAKDGGKGQYQSKGRKKNAKASKEASVKKKNSSGSFDIRI